MHETLLAYLHNPVFLFHSQVFFMRRGFVRMRDVAQKRGSSRVGRIDKCTHDFPTPPFCDGDLLSQLLEVATRIDSHWLVHIHDGEFAFEILRFKLSLSSFLGWIYVTLPFRLHKLKSVKSYGSMIMNSEYINKWLSPIWIHYSGWKDTCGVRVAGNLKEIWTRFSQSTDIERYCRLIHHELHGKSCAQLISGTRCPKGHSDVHVFIEGAEAIPTLVQVSGRATCDWCWCRIH
jgi:hypothetical protein